MEKATFRLPEWQLQRMRELSTDEHRSLNSVAADVIAHGLGEAPQHAERAAAARALGPLLLTPARAAYVRGRTAPSPVPLIDALDWSRGER